MKILKLNKHFNRILEDNNGVWPSVPVEVPPSIITTIESREVSFWFSHRDDVCYCMYVCDHWPEDKKQYPYIMLAAENLICMIYMLEGETKFSIEILNEKYSGFEKIKTMLETYMFENVVLNPESNTTHAEDL